jgi:Ca2+-binding RTX toxin-like protein
VPYTFSTQEKSEIEAARLLCPAGDGPEDVSFSGNWVPFYTALSNILSRHLVAADISGTDSTNFKAAKLWLDVAIGANGSAGMHSAFIRTYTDRQGELRTGSAFPTDVMQKASNGVALNLYRDLKGIGGDVEVTPWTISKIAKIAAADASSIGRNLFSNLLSATDDAVEFNSAWSGALGFNLLGGSAPFESWRLLVDVSRGESNQKAAVNSLDDFKNLLYAVDSYNKGLSAGYAEGGIDFVKFVSASMYAATTGQWPSDNAGPLVAQFAVMFSSGNVFGLIKDIAARTPTISPVINAIVDIGINKFLDMLMGAVQGKSLIGTTTDGNFAANARAFLGALSPSQLESINASLMPTNAAAIASLAHTDVSARSALVALSVVKVQVSPEIAQQLQLYNPETAPNGLTETWLSSRAQMLHAVASTRAGQNAVGPTNTDYFDAGSNTTVVQRINGIGANAPANKVAFGAGESDSLQGTANALGDRLYGMAGGDTLDGKEGNDYLEGGAGSDTYQFGGAFGKDIVWDTDGQGLVLIDAQTLVETKAAGVLNTWVAKLGDGQIVGLAVYNDPSSSTDKKLVITRPGTTANTITINNFDMDAAQGSDGYLGIKLQDTPELVIAASGTAAVVDGNPFAAWDFDPDTFSGSSITSTAKSFTIYLNQAVKAGATLVLHLGDLAGKNIKAVLGDTEVDADGATIPLTEGQTQVSFALVGRDDMDAAATGALTVTYQQDGQTATSNAWNLTWRAATEARHTFNGDINKKIVTDSDGTRHYVFDSAYANFAPDEAAPNQPNAADVITGDWYEADKIMGFGGDDALAGWGGDDFIDGGEGTDVLMGALGADTIKGGAGHDAIYGSSRGVLPYELDPDAAPPQLPGGTVIGQGWGWRMATSEVHFAHGWTPHYLNEELVRDQQAGDQGNVIDAGTGNDAVYAGTGDDLAEGGEGDDQLAGMGGSDVLLGDDDNDLLVGDGDQVEGSIMRTLEGEQGSDFLDGGAGNDTLFGQGRSDNLFGGAGNDLIWGDDESIAETPGASNGNDYLDGEDGDDTLIGGGADDELYGGAGNDQMQGDHGLTDVLPIEFHGADYLDGEEGDDQIAGGGKADQLFGGAGKDTLVGDAGGNAEGERGYLDPAFHGDDLLDGEEDDDYLMGEGGSDILFGGSGNDFVFGDTPGRALPGRFHGADTLDGEEGDDTLVGGGGSDFVMGGLGNDRLFGDGDVAEEFEGDDALDGGEGNDAIAGGGGADYIAGGAGNDSLWGEAGDDVLDGGDGDDVLQSGPGNDTLIGGAGRDVFFVDADAGHVTVEASAAIDEVQFSPNIALAGVTGTLSGSSLLLNLGSTLSVTVEGDAFFRFADGTVFTRAGMETWTQSHPPVPPPPQYGTTVTNLYDDHGNPNGSSVVTIDPNGTNTTLHAGPDGTGAKLSETWTTVRGGHGSDTFNSNGSSSGTAYNVDGSRTTYTDDGAGTRMTEWFDGSGVKTGANWGHADGSHGAEVFYTDGSSSGTVHHADGSYDLVTKDENGQVRSRPYDAAGLAIGDLSEITYTDGRYRVTVAYGPQDSVSTLFRADGTKQSESWMKPDGTHGQTVYSNAGNGSTVYSADGAYKTITNPLSRSGQTLTEFYSVSGELTGSSITEIDGLNSITSYRDASGAKTSETWVHPDGSTGTDAVGSLDFNGLLNFVAHTYERDLSDFEEWETADGSGGWFSYEAGDYGAHWYLYDNSSPAGIAYSWENVRSL